MFCSFFLFLFFIVFLIGLFCNIFHGGMNLIPSFWFQVLGSLRMLLLLRYLLSHQNFKHASYIAGFIYLFFILGNYWRIALLFGYFGRELVGNVTKKHEDEVKYKENPIPFSFLRGEDFPTVGYYGRCIFHFRMCCVRMRCANYIFQAYPIS